MDVRTLCLGVLSMGDASGYEIKKRLEDGFRHFYDASYGSIYPALSRLQQEGLVDCTREAQSKRPDKKIYSLTPDGRLYLARELSGDLGPDRVRCEFLVAMLFADLLPASHIARLIDRRLDDHRALVSELNAKLETANPAQKFVAGYGAAIYAAAIKYLEENRYLVESEALIAQVDRSRDRVATHSAAGD